MATLLCANQFILLSVLEDEISNSLHAIYLPTLNFGSRLR